MSYQINVGRGGLIILGLSMIILPTRMSELEKVSQMRNAEENYADSNGLRYLTNVNGKAYFVNEQYFVNWTNGAAYCRNLDLVLGRIESKEEWNALKIELESYPSGGVWTDARESRLPAMFSWNDTKEPLDPAIISGWDDQYVKKQPYIYCVVFFSFSSDEHVTGLYPVPCGNKQTVLCQTK